MRKLAADLFAKLQTRKKTSGSFGVFKVYLPWTFRRADTCRTFVSTDPCQRVDALLLPDCCSICCMKRRCISAVNVLYRRIQHARTVPHPLSWYTANTAYTLIQQYSVYTIHPYTPSLWCSYRMVFFWGLFFGANDFLAHCGRDCCE